CPDINDPTFLSTPSLASVTFDVRPLREEGRPQQPTLSNRITLLSSGYKRVI
ncbi:hypothetical protein NPIL_468211, partial [Nephila pilipes]